MKRKLIVSVVGETKTGKSTIAATIFAELKQLGLDVVLHDDEMTFTEIKELNRDALADIANKVKIHVCTMQVAKL